MSTDFVLLPSAVEEAGQTLQEQCHGLAYACGWWTSPNGNDQRSYVQPDHRRVDLVNVPEKLCLIHSEISEGMEGFRKDLKDDKLTHRDMLEVELADAVILCFDLAGGLGYDLAGAIAEKLSFNAKRADHKPENRALPGGKKF
jgi:hypothetical protein